MKGSLSAPEGRKSFVAKVMEINLGKNSLAKQTMKKLHTGFVFVLGIVLCSWRSKGNDDGRWTRDIPNW